jgi:hypothetical protein
MKVMYSLVVVKYSNLPINCLYSIGRDAHRFRTNVTSVIHVKVEEVDLVNNEWSDLMKLEHILHELRVRHTIFY